MSTWNVEGHFPASQPTMITCAIKDHTATAICLLSDPHTVRGGTPHAQTGKPQEYAFLTFKTGTNQATFPTASQQ